jgi:flagellar biosynthesis/type III secretory pathway protein FliH
MVLNVLDNPVLGREYKRGFEEGFREGFLRAFSEGSREGLHEAHQRAIQQCELSLLCRLIEMRFGTLPQWARERIQRRSAAEIEAASARFLAAESLEELLN